MESDNIFYDADQFGLSVVAELEDPAACDSFDTVIVWKDAQGNYFWDHDSGCSCPTPFEDINSVADLSPLTQDTWEAFLQFVVEDWVRESWSEDHKPSYRQEAAVKFLNEVSTDILTNIVVALTDAIKHFQSATPQFEDTSLGIQTYPVGKLLDDA